MLIDTLRRWVENPAPPTDLPPLPKVEAPHLHDLVVVVPPLPADREVTAERLMELFDERVRACSPRRRRETGEFAAVGDEVVLDLAFFHEGKALAFTAGDRETFVVGAPGQKPDIGPQLVGCTYEEVAAIRHTFPDDHEAAWLRGVSGTWRARVLEIDEVLTPDGDDPAFLEKLGITLDMQGLMEALKDEEINRLAYELKQSGVEQALDLLRARSPLTIPRELVERELFERWAAAEGQVLLRLGAGESDLNLSFAAWLRSDEAFADAERRVHISALLGAIAERDQLQLTEDALRQTLEIGAAMAGVTVQEAKEAIRDNPVQRRAVEQDAFHLMLVEHVLEKARVRYL